MKSKYLKRAIILLNKKNEIDLDIVSASDFVLTTKDNRFVVIKYDADSKYYEAPYITAKGNKKQLILLKKKLRHETYFFERDYMIIWKKKRRYKIYFSKSGQIAKVLYTYFLIGDEIPEKFYAQISQMLQMAYSVKR